MIHPIKAVPDEREVNENEYELPEHIVKVKELLPEDIAEQNNWIGQNRVNESRLMNYEKKDIPRFIFYCIGGPTILQMRIDNNDDTDVENSTLATEVDDSVPGMTATSLKEVRKIVNNQASASMQNDKIFRKKNKLEKLKNRKKAARKRNLLKREQKKLKGRRRKQ